MLTDYAIITSRNRWFAAHNRKAVVFYLAVAVVPVLLILFGEKSSHVRILGWIILATFFLMSVLK